MKYKNREPWPSYFLKIAELVSTRSTCDRANVGCVIVRDNRILTTGYNGSPSGTEHCDEAGHLLDNGHCIRTIHAEVNAIAQAALMGVSVNDSTCYLTHTPCYTCAKQLFASGIWKVICKQKYGNDEAAVELFDIRGGITYY